MITAEQVREAIRTQELTQTKVARMAKVSDSVLSRWLSGQGEPSDVSKARVMLALGLGEPGELDAQTLNAAMRPEEDAAAAEIMNILSESAPEPDPAPEPAPIPAPAPRRVSAVELIRQLLALPGVDLFENEDESFCISLRDEAVAQFCANLVCLNNMLDHDDIAPDAHRIAVDSLIDRYKAKEGA